MVSAARASSLLSLTSSPKEVPRLLFETEGLILDWIDHKLPGPHIQASNAAFSKFFCFPIPHALPHLSNGVMERGTLFWLISPMNNVAQVHLGAECGGLLYLSQIMLSNQKSVSGLACNK